MDKKELIRLIVKCSKDVIEIIEDITLKQQKQDKRLKILEKEIEEIKLSSLPIYDRVDSFERDLNNPD
jgi:hypothetical protein